MAPSLTDWLLSPDAAAALCATLPSQRWFRGKDEPVLACRVQRLFQLRPGSELTWAVIRVEQRTGHRDYLLGLLLSSTPTQLTLARVAEGGPYLLDAADPELASLDGPDAAAELTDLVRGAPRCVSLYPADVGAMSLTGRSFHGGPPPFTCRARAVAGEQSNTTWLVDTQLAVKLLRVLDEGAALEATVLQHLATSQAPTPPLLGLVELHDGPASWPIALVQRFVANRGTAWEVALAAAQDFLEGNTASQAQFWEFCRRAGERTAEVHRALARQGTGFGTRSPTSDDFHWQADSFRERLGAACKALAGRKEADGLLPRLHRLDPEQLARATVTTGHWLRIHGDLHLGQLLATDQDVTVIDFEGEPARSAPDRARHRSALTDLAGMVRSFSYAAEVAHRSLQGVEGSRSLANHWTTEATRAYVEGWWAQAQGASFAPTEIPLGTPSLRALTVEKALYELHYEASHRPAWLSIPLQGLAELLEKAL